MQKREINESAFLMVSLLVIDIRSEGWGNWRGPSGYCRPEEAGKFRISQTQRASRWCVRQSRSRTSGCESNPYWRSETRPILAGGELRMLTISFKRFPDIKTYVSSALPDFAGAHL